MILTLINTDETTTVFDVAGRNCLSQTYEGTTQLRVRNISTDIIELIDTVQFQSIVINHDDGSTVELPLPSISTVQLTPTDIIIHYYNATPKAFSGVTRVNRTVLDLSITNSDGLFTTTMDRVSSVEFVKTVLDIVNKDSSNTRHVCKPVPFTMKDMAGKLLSDTTPHYRCISIEKLLTYTITDTKNTVTVVPRKNVRGYSFI